MRKGSSALNEPAEPRDGCLWLGMEICQHLSSRVCGCPHQRDLFPFPFGTRDRVPLLYFQQLGPFVLPKGFSMTKAGLRAELPWKFAGVPSATGSSEGGLDSEGWARRETGPSEPQPDSDPPKAFKCPPCGKPYISSLTQSRCIYIMPILCQLPTWLFNINSF